MEKQMFVQEQKRLIWEDRIRAIKELLVNTPPSLCVERANLITQAYQQYERETPLIKRAHALEIILSEMTLSIEPLQLLAGNQASLPRSAPVFPEYSVGWLENELDTLYSRSGDSFQVDEADKEELRRIFPYWHGKTLQERANVLQPDDVHLATSMGVVEWEGNVTSGEGHITVNYPELVQIGWGGYLNKLQANLDSLDLSDPANHEKYEFYLAAIITIRAASHFTNRYATLCKRLAHQENDPRRRHELEELSRLCQEITLEAPKNFYAALQLVWFAHLILQIESNGHSFSLGRMDQYLLPFFSKDLEAGLITKEKACELVGCFYLKLFMVNKVRSYSHSLVVSGYPTYQNICVAGQNENGEDATNPLSYIFLQVLASTRLSEPNFYIRVHENIDPLFMNMAAEVVRLGFGMPAFVNDKVIIPSLTNRGVTYKDAVDYATMGCLEVSVPGKWGYRANGKSKFNLAKILEITLNGGCDPSSGKRMLETKGLGTYGSFEDVLDAWKAQVEYFTRLHVTADNFNSLAIEQLVPDAFCSTLISDCIGRGKPINTGGAIYDMQSGAQIGLANVANSLAAIKKLVFEQGIISQQELKEALASNFAGESGRKIQSLLLRQGPKYGNDDDYADELAVAVCNTYCDEISKYHNNRFGKGPIGGGWYASTVTISANIPSGKKVGATPDGRNASTPLADGCSPSHNTERKGPTAVIRSVDKLPNLLITGGNLLNCRILPSTIRDQEGLERLIALIQTHFKLYGWHIQFNTIDTETLKDAQRRPEFYRDLTVRVAGYSALFVALDKEVQNDIIDRMSYAV